MLSEAPAPESLAPACSPGPRGPLGGGTASTHRSHWCRRPGAPRCHCTGGRGLQGDSRGVRQGCAVGDAGPGGPRTCTGARPQGRPRPVPALLGLGARQARPSGGATSLTLAALAPLSLASTSTPQSAGPPTHPLPAPQAPPTPLRRGMRVPLGRPVRPHTTGFGDLGRTAAWALVRPLGRWEPRPRPLGPGRLMPLNTSEGLCIQPNSWKPGGRPTCGRLPSHPHGAVGGQKQGH